MRKKVLVLLIAFLTPYLIQAASITLPAGVTTRASYSNTDVVVPDKSELRLTAANPLTNSTITLTTEDSWVLFENVKPSDVITNYLSSINVNGAPFVNNGNGRVAIYAHGSMVMPHPAGYEPLTVYTGTNFRGKSKSYVSGTSAPFTNLGEFDNSIKSFKLKRGYMATLATAPDGSGYSRVFVADTEDLEFKTMPTWLDGTVSFIRVFKFEWVSKKAYGGSSNDAKILRATSYYNWSDGYEPDPDVEFVPHKHGGNSCGGCWPSFNSINANRDANTVMGLNEPDKSDQVNMSYTDAMEYVQPNFYASGFRVTSPCTSDFYNGWGQAPYIRECVNERNYRIDISNVHAYQKTGWWNAGRLTDISNRSAGRPIWITEWNNGCNWSWGAGDQIHLANDYRVGNTLDAIKYIVGVMDAHPKLERYFIYQWCHYGFQLIIPLDNGFKDANPDWQNYNWLKSAPVIGKTNNGEDIVLTPAGQWYRDHNAPLAYSKASESIPHWNTFIPKFSTSMRENNSILSINITDDPGNEMNLSYVIEMQTNDGSFEMLKEFSNSPVLSRLDIPLDDLESGSYNFRMYVKGMDDSVTETVDIIGIALTADEEITTGHFAVNSPDWITAYLGHNYSTAPAVIFGTPSFNNSRDLYTNKIQTLTTSRVRFRMSGWDYMELDSYEKTETLPFLIIPKGSYDLGGLSASVESANASGSWTTISFNVPEGYFSEPPVVIPTQTSSRQVFPKSIHIKNVTTTGFDVLLRKEAAQAASITNETFNYLAASEGIGFFNGKRIAVGTVTNVGHTASSARDISWGDNLENDLLFTHAQTAEDDHAFNTRVYLKTANSAKVLKQVEASNGTPAGVKRETVGWVVYGELPSSVKSTSTKGFSLQSNLVKDKLVFVGDKLDNVHITIYNLYGASVKSGIIENNIIDVSSLQSGVYMIYSKSNGVTKFIKQ